MTQTVDERMAELEAQNAGFQAAMDRATRTALLEHARMGRSVYEGHKGQIVEVTPEEIFARYGFDANGRPLETRT